MNKHLSLPAAFVAAAALTAILVPGPAAWPAVHSSLRGASDSGGGQGSTNRSNTSRSSDGRTNSSPSGNRRTRGIGAASEASGPYLTVTGFGYGHGRGMGQWGAFGYASELGWSYQQILAHFYGGTTLGTISLPEPDITVHLLQLDGRNTIAAAVEGTQLVATWGTGASAVDSAFEVARTGGTQALYSSTGCAGPWHEVAVTTGAVTLASAAPSGVPAPVSTSQLTACIPGVGQRTYQGHLVGQPDGETQNVVGLEDYVDGVVPAESPASWAAQGGEAELEAQAVAARSYALAYVAMSGEVCDSTACQMYLGLPEQYGLTADNAVAATAGEVLYCDAGSACGPAGTVALAEYSASTGGYSAGGAFPAVPDLGDSVSANPVHSWSVTVPLGEVEAAFPTLGPLVSVVVSERNGLGALGGRAQFVALGGANGSLAVTGQRFAAALRLPSDWFQVSPLLGGSVLSTTTTVPPGAPTFAPGATTTTAVPPGSAATTTTAVPPGSAATTTVPMTTVPIPLTPIAATTTTAPMLPYGEDQGHMGPEDGYWVVDRRGMVSAFGGAVSYGTAAGTRIQGQVVAMAAPPDYQGYWLAGADGGVLAFGDARWYGSASDIHLRQPLVAMAATRDGRGYWLVSGDGGVFAYGDALYYGSLAPFRLGLHVTAFAPTPDGRGYWLATGAGAVFAFGDAGFYGSPAGRSLTQPITGLLPTADGHGYLMVARDGGVFAYGDATYMGSLPSERARATVVAAAPTYDGRGYYMLSAAGRIFAFGGAPPAAAAGARLSSVAVAIVSHWSFAAIADMP